MGRSIGINWYFYPHLLYSKSGVKYTFLINMKPEKKLKKFKDYESCDDDYFPKKEKFKRKNKNYKKDFE